MALRKIPSLNWLRVFEAAAQAESFARAAEALGMSPPAVSQQIRALEGHLGVALFRRMPHRVALTEAGRAFLPVVRHALASVETTAAALFGPDGQQTVRIQAVTLLAMSWLPARLAAFEAANRGVFVDVTTGETLSDFLVRAPGRPADLAIAFGAATDFPDDAAPLFGERLRPVARPDVAAAITEPEDFLGPKLFEVTTHRVGWLDILARLDGIEARRARLTMVDHTPLALMMAASGAGIALARTPASDGMVAALGLAPVAAAPPALGVQRYFLLTPQTRPLSRAARALRDWIVDAAAADAGAP